MILLFKHVKYTYIYLNGIYIHKNILESKNRKNYYIPSVIFFYTNI